MKDQLQEGPAKALTKGAFALAVVSMAVYLVALNWFKMSNNDIWIHLTTGEWILENGWVPGNDIYSWNATHRPYVAFEWLAGVFYYFIFELGGVTGLLMSKIATVVVMWALLYDTARLLGARLSVLLPGLGILMYIASARILVRPHVITYLFIALFIWLFFNYRQRGRRRLWLYLLLPAQALWINLHGAWPTGVLLVLTFALGELLIWLRARHLGLQEERAISTRDMILLAILPFATVLVNFFNPYGWVLITFPFEVFDMAIYMKGIYEWKPPYDPAFNRSTMFFFYLVELALLTFGFFLVHRGNKRLRSTGDFTGFANNAMMGILGLFFLILAFWWMQPAGNSSSWNAGNLEYALYFLFGLFSVYTVLNFRTVDFTQAGIFGMLFLLSLRHNRNVTDAAVGIFPIMAAASSMALARMGSKPMARRAGKGRRKKKALPDESPAEQAAAQQPTRAYPHDPSSPWSVIAWSVFLLIVSAFTLTFTYYYDFRGSGREKGLGVASNMPICGVDFIEKHHITGNAFTSYPYAAPLIHRMYPEVKVNMDSRNGHVYGEQIYLDYLRTLRDPSLMREYLVRNDVDFFFLSHGDRSSQVFDQLARTGEWAVVYMDNRGFVMVRRTPENADLIASEEFRIVRPSSWGQTPVNASTAPAVLAESERAIGNCPSSSFGYFYKLRAEAVMGRYDDAISTGQTIIEMNPRNAQVHSFVGSMYEALGRTQDAIEMYDRALAINPGLKSARDSLTRLRGF